ncbi:MAG: glycosyltransferase family 39 protein [Planctomycetia bacterium]|nr:glycosyltransferase family 39 protein [Planctomycetia bacterium]
MGADFVAANGKRTFWLLTLGRWACIPLSLVGGWTCFAWARDLFGLHAGVVATALWCFSPNVIAHGQLITPDLCATSLGLIACYSFWRWLQCRSWTRATIAGTFLGASTAAKTTMGLLVPVWVLLWAVLLLSNGGRCSARSRWREGGMLLFVLTLGLFVINAVYGFEGCFQRLRDFQFVSRALTISGGEPSGGLDTSTNGVRRNRFADASLGAVPIPLPRDYLLGIDVQQRDFEDPVGPSYLRGRFQQNGWWYYYLYAVAVKTPLGTALLGVLVLGVVIRKRSDGALWQDQLALLAPAFVIFAVVSYKCEFTHHMRYILPCFPFAFIYISQLGRSLHRSSSQIRFVVPVALAWSLASSMWVYPHSLSYFNELAGGPRSGHGHLINSSIDWGQDLTMLMDWRREHPDCRPFYMAYYGNFDPRHVGLDYELPSERCVTGDEQHVRDVALQLRPGWYAVSVNLLHGFPHCVYDDHGTLTDLDSGLLTQLLQREPEATAGYSIHIYHISPN